MAFSLAEWTVPELCVWIVTRSKDDLNNLPTSAKNSLKFTELLHDGTYAARDEILSKAQEGLISVTCRRPGGTGIRGIAPARMALPPEFWKTAELLDASSWMSPGGSWCVARRLGEVNDSEYSGLLVSSFEALNVWKPREIPDHPGLGPASAHAPVEINEARRAKPTDQDMLNWIERRRGELRSSGERHGRDRLISEAAGHFGVPSKSVRSIWDARGVSKKSK